MKPLLQNLYQIAIFVILMIWAHTHTPPLTEWSSVIWFSLGWVQPVPPESVIVCMGEEGNGVGEESGPLFPLLHRRKQGCYNLFSWLSMKVRGRATRVCLNPLPSTPTVYFYVLSPTSTLSLSALFILPFTCSSRNASQSHVIITHSFGLSLTFNFSQLLLLLFRLSSLFFIHSVAWKLFLWGWGWLSVLWKNNFSKY